MSEQTITLNRDQIDSLRSKGQAFHRREAGELMRLTRDGSGYTPLPGATDEVVLTLANLDELEREGELLVMRFPGAQDSIVMRVDRS